MHKLRLLNVNEIEDNLKYRRRVKENQITKVYKSLTREGYAFIDLDETEGVGATFGDFMELVEFIKEKINDHGELGYIEEANNLWLNEGSKVEWE